MAAGLHPSAAPDRLEDEILAVGHALEAATSEGGPHGPLAAADRKAMELAAADRELRAALFRLVDVTPACRSLEDLGGHLAGLLEELPDRPPSLAAALGAAHTKAGRVALGAATAAAVRHMAHRFIVGESPADAGKELRAMRSRGIAASLDLLGEATVTDAEADGYAARCSAALDELSGQAAAWSSPGPLERDSLGALPPVNLSIKVSALTARLRPEAPRVGLEDAAERLRPLLRRARDLRAHLHVDMEHLDTLETTLGLVLELLAEPEFAAGPSAGIVVQAYLRSSPDELERILEWAGETDREAPLTVRLVKGAYWDSEVVEASQHGWEAPVFTDKADCDRNFEELTRRLLSSPAKVRVAVGSHNLRSVAHAIAYDRLVGGGADRLELQTLRGLGDELAETLAAEGHRVRVYCPCGDLVAGMAYLVRRLLENTSNESFLLAQSSGAPLHELLAKP